MWMDSDSGDKIVGFWWVPWLTRKQVFGSDGFFHLLAPANFFLKDATVGGR